MSLALRRMSGIELLALVDGFTGERVDAVSTGADETYLALVDGHLQPLAQELRRRIARAEEGRGPNPRAGWIADLTGAAAQIRRTADIRYPLNLNGWQPVRQSPAGEFAGPCFLCGGHDRFVTWPCSPDRDGRAWCRRCHWSGDVIALYRDLEGVSFVRALEDLAAVFDVHLARVAERDARVVAANARRVLEVAS